MTASRASRVRAWAVRSQVLSLLKASSMGLKSGEYGGKYSRRAPRASTISARPATLCTDKLSSTTTSPGTSVGPSTWSR